MALGRLSSARAAFSFDVASSAAALMVTATPCVDEMAISRGRSTGRGSEVSGNMPLSGFFLFRFSSSTTFDSASTATASAPPAGMAFSTASTSAADFASV